MTELLRVERLKKYFSRGPHLLKAVDDVSFSLAAGETLGLLGESGSGKSTLGRTILRLHEPTAGTVHFQGTDLLALKREEMRMKRRHMQMIFQDPLAALNPRMTVGQAIEDPLVVHGVRNRGERKERVRELLSLVGLRSEAINNYPYEFSGGQQQRVGIARALALNPQFIVCDEPVSALDVSIQAQIMTLLNDLRQKFNLSYLFIAHDLGIIRYIADVTAVLYLGRIVQIGPTSEVYRHPAHPYTRAMIASVPRVPKNGIQQRQFEALKGEIPSPIHLPQGCRFASRCPIAQDRCRKEDPSLRVIGPRHQVACHFA